MLRCLVEEAIVCGGFLDLEVNVSATFPDGIFSSDFVLDPFDLIEDAEWLERAALFMRAGPLADCGWIE
jgi:hypothetical protein